MVGMNQIPTAFPWTHENMTCTGMTLRDYFAAKAMQALIQRNSDDSAYGNNMVDGRPMLAYEYADAMLKAREK